MLSAQWKVGASIRCCRLSGREARQFSEREREGERERERERERENFERSLSLFAVESSVISLASQGLEAIQRWLSTGAQKGGEVCLPGREQEQVREVKPFFSSMRSKGKSRRRVTSSEKISLFFQSSTLLKKPLLLIQGKKENRAAPWELALSSFIRSLSLARQRDCLSMPLPRPRAGRPRRHRPERGFLFLISISVVAFASFFAPAAATTTASSPSPSSSFFPLGPPSDCSPAGVSMTILPLTREEAESCAAGGGGGGGGGAKRKESCRVSSATTKEKEKASASSSAETVYFSWSPLSESESSNSTTLLDTTGTPVKPARMPDSLFASKSSLRSSLSSSPSPPSSSSSLSPSPSPSSLSSSYSSSSPPPSLPSSFALVRGRLLLEVAGNYTFFLASDGLSSMELGGGGAEDEKAGSNNKTTTTTATTATKGTLLSRSPKPFSLLLPSPRALDLSVAYLPDPVAASHFLTLEWEFREGGRGGGGGGGGGGGAEKALEGGERDERSSSSSPSSLSSTSSSSLPKGNRRAIERGAVWPSALVGPKCQGPGGAIGGRKRKKMKKRSSRRLLKL